MNPKAIRFAVIFSYCFWILLAMVIFHACAGCTTVHQSEVTPNAAGFTAQPIREGDHYLIDDAFRARYNALIGIYGRKKLENGAPVFLPPLKKDDGVTAIAPGQWRMTYAAMENMAVLSDMKRRGTKP